MTIGMREMVCIGGKNDGLRIHANAERGRFELPIPGPPMDVSYKCSEYPMVRMSIETEYYRVAYINVAQLELAVLVHSSLTDLQATEMLWAGYRKPLKDVA